MIIKVYRFFFKIVPAFLNTKTVNLLQRKKPLLINFINDEYIYKNIEKGYVLLYKEHNFGQKNLTFNNFSTNLALFSEESLAKLHSFCWLQDLKLIDSKVALDHLFILIDSWIDNYSDSNHKIAFSLNVLASRIFNLLTSAKAIAVKDERFKNKLLKSLSFQIRFFLKVYALSKKGDHLLLNKTLFVIGKALNSSRITNIAVNNIILFLKKNVLADGGVKSKAPSAVLEALEHTLFIFKNLNKNDLTFKNELRAFVDKMIVFIKSVRYSDGGLGVFSGGFEEDSNKIDFILSLGNISAKPFNNLRYSGYLNLAIDNKIRVLLKTGSIETKNSNNIADSILSQEILVKGERIFVNNSKPIFLQEDKIDRSAYSTMLFFDKNNKLIAMPKESTAQDCKVEQRIDADWKAAFVTYKGLKNDYGVTWHKSLSLAKKGSCILGEELLNCNDDTLIKKVILKFILHPSVVVNDANKDKLNISLEIGNESWVFRTSKPFFITSEVYSAIKEESFPTLAINIPMDMKDKSIEWSLVQSAVLSSALQKILKAE